MPVDYRQYPSNWHMIREFILGRSGHCCEQCGAKNCHRHPVTDSYVVLTIAHLDHDITHNEPGNLKALCQRCHNRLDAPDRAKNRRLKKDSERGQGYLF